MPLTSTEVYQIAKKTLDSIAARNETLDQEVKDFIKQLVAEYGGPGSDETLAKIIKDTTEPLTRAAEESALTDAFLGIELAKSRTEVSAEDKAKTRAAIRTLLVQTIHYQIMLVVKPDSLGVKDDSDLFPNFDSLVARAKALNYPAKPATEAKTSGAIAHKLTMRI